MKPVNQMNRFLTSVIFLVLFIQVEAGCPDFNREMTWQQQLCRNPYSAETCNRLIEERQAKIYKENEKYIRRSGEELVLTLLNGDTLVFKNRRVDGEGAVVYYFRYFCGDLGYFLISRGFYEGGDYPMINFETGKVTAIDGLPFLSPDQSRFVTTVADFGYGYSSKNGVKIWKFTESEIILEWSFNSDDHWGFDEPVWIDSSTIELQQIMGPNYRKAPVTLTKGEKGWELRQK